MKWETTLGFSLQASIAFEVNSVRWSLMIRLGYRARRSAPSVPRYAATRD